MTFGYKLSISFVPLRVIYVNFIIYYLRHYPFVRASVRPLAAFISQITEWISVKFGTGNRRLKFI